MLRRTGIVLGTAVAAVALSLGTVPAASAAGPGAQAADTTAGVPWPWRIHGTYTTLEACQAAGTAREPLFGKVWWCSLNGYGYYDLWGHA
ncbi:hypothetical protein AB0G74_31840 [Streptomyces sp. NPDC020875]|uniref:hypothetical protein n=1 Tax=Streptomyces sp. NPDC020875 TaxID=3154898 RepID=UPI0033D5E35A